MREKLIELLDKAKSGYEDYLAEKDRKMRMAKTDADFEAEANTIEIRHSFYARELITDGVTVQQWIPVSERLPKTIPCGAGTEYSEAVNVLTSGRKVLTAIWDGTDFIADAEFWEAEGEEITHWTPVLLPLPAGDAEQERPKATGSPEDGFGAHIARRFGSEV